MREKDWLRVSQKSKKKNQPIHQSMRKIKKTGYKVYYLMCLNHIVFKLLI